MNAWDIAAILVGEGIIELFSYPNLVIVEPADRLFQDDMTTEVDDLIERDFAWFELKVRFGRILYIEKGLGFIKHDKPHSSPNHFRMPSTPKESIQMNVIFQYIQGRIFRHFNAIEHICLARALECISRPPLRNVITYL